jgi:alanine-synthesizing transaminase
MFSSRTGWDVSESSFAAAVREARAKDGKGTGARLLDLTVSNPTVCGFAYDAEAILAPLSAAGALVYEPDARGRRSAREAVAGYYADHGAEVDPDAVLLTTSTSEGYGFLFRLLCNGGDEVLVAQPSYPLFDFLADLEDVRLQPYPLFYDFGWWIDFAELERRIGPRTKAILVVHPNNPTGHWTARGERERLRDICKRHGLVLIVDEVFLDYPLRESAEVVSFAAEGSPVPTFVLSGLSKVAALPQMKAAWVVALGPEAERREALGRLEVIADTFLSMNAPVQHALPAWLATRGPIQEQIRRRTRTNLEAAEASGVDVLRTEAGWSCVLRVTRQTEELVRELGVVVHPGSFYGMAEAHRVVVSLLTSTADFAEGIRRLESI